MKTRFGVLLIAFAGCSGTDTSPNDAPCTAYAASKCTRVAACSTAVMQRRYGTLTACQAREKLTCIDALTAPQTSNSATNFTACGASYASQSCADVANNVAPTVCVVTGPRANGSPCGVPAQCQSGFCSIPLAAPCGTCAAMPSAGDSCATTTCGRTLDCVASTQLCQQLGAAQAACDTDHPCLAGLACVGSTSTVMGTCQPELVTAGAACDPTRKTAADCDRDQSLACGPGTKQCVAVVYVADQQACGNVNGVITLCTSGVCYGSTATQNGTCQILAADGAPCDTVNGPGCQVGSRCIGTTSSGGAVGTCQPLAPAGCG